MGTFRDSEVWALAKKQRGVVATWQIAKLGVKQSALRKRRFSGEWVRVLRGVVRMAWADESWLQRVWAVWLWAGPVSAISHWAAAAVHGLPVEKPRLIEVTVPARFVPVCSRRWVWVHRSRSLEPSVMVKVDGLRVTSACRTLLDLAAVVPTDDLERLVQHAVNSGLVTTSALEAYVKRGNVRKGIGAFRKAIALTKQWC